MKRSIVARGKLSDPRHIELKEPVRAIRGEVEVAIRPLPTPRAEDVFDVIAGLTPGARSKKEIDRQLRAERNGWAGR